MTLILFASRLHPLARWPTGTGKSSLLLRFSEETFTPNFITTIGIDFKIKTIELNGKRVKLQIWDTAGQERFRTITTAYYRGAQGILLVYDVTDEDSFKNIRNWIKNIENHAADNVEKLLVGNKCDMVGEKVVEKSQGLSLAEEYGIPFFETSAKNNINVVEAFHTMANEVLVKMKPDNQNNDKVVLGNNNGKKKSGCC